MSPFQRLSDASGATLVIVATWLPVLVLFATFVLDVGTTGTRLTALHVVPFVDVLYTMSLAEQPLRNRQSAQATYTVPPPSTSAEGRPSPSRMPPAGGWNWSELMSNGPV